jgi:hypothetical protein
MSNKTKFNLSIIVFIFSLSFIYLFSFNKPAISPQTTQKANTEEIKQLKTYTYKITKIDDSGYYGKSTKDHTGIYFVNSNVPKGTVLNEGDTIKVSFPNNSYEEITHIEKINQ